MRGKDIVNWSAVTVEADARAYANLLAYIASDQNKIDSVVPIHAAVSTSGDFMTPFFENSTNREFGNSTANISKANVWNKRFGGMTKTVSRGVFCLNTFYQWAQDKYDLIVIKMDIEGSEYDVLPSFIDKVIPEKTPVIFIEFHDKKIGLPPRVTESLIASYSEKHIKFKDWNAATKL